jgi:hypothetical protein
VRRRPSPRKAIFRRGRDAFNNILPWAPTFVSAPPVFDTHNGLWPRRPTIVSPKVSRQSRLHRAQEAGVGFPRARQDREVEAARSAGIGRPRRLRARPSMHGYDGSNAYGDDDVAVALQPRGRHPPRSRPAPPAPWPNRPRPRKGWLARNIFSAQDVPLASFSESADYSIFACSRAFDLVLLSHQSTWVRTKNVFGWAPLR